MIAVLQKLSFTYLHPLKCDVKAMILLFFNIKIM